MRFLVLLLLTLLAVMPRSTYAQVWISSTGSKPSPPTTQSPNTPGGEELSDVVRNARASDTLICNTYFKDRNEGNAAGLEEYTLYGRRPDGTWVVDEQLSFGTCGYNLNADMTVFSAIINLNDPAYTGYQVGDWITFRVYFRFRDAFCAHVVERDQYLYVLKGEPLPLFPGQYAASLHTHLDDDNAGEWSQTRNILVPSAAAADIDIVVTSGHLYEYTQTTWNGLVTFCQNESTPRVKLIPGGEGHVDNNQVDNNPLNAFIHTLTNVCVLTPVEGLPGAEQTATALMFLPTFRAAVDAAPNGWWKFAHPWANAPIPQLGAIAAEIDSTHVVQAQRDSSFAGYQAWNLGRTSFKKRIDLEARVLDFRPWVQDPNWDADVERSLVYMDQIQQQNLSPVFSRVTLSAGPDNHGDYNQSLRPGGTGIDADNGAFGTLFTVVTLPDVTEVAVRRAMLQGNSYPSNGPALEWGVDWNNDGTLETSFGDVNTAARGGDILLRARSNDEHGTIIRAIVYFLTPTSKDSVVVSMSGMEDETSFSVASVVGTEPTAVRARVDTGPGYGENPGRAYANPIYFNVTDTGTDVAADRRIPRVVCGQNPTRTGASFWWSEFHPTHVSVVDVSGREVYTERLDPSTSGWRWRGQSAAGSRTAAGVYLVVLRSADDRIVRKVTLLR